MKVSIVTSSFNQAPYLARAIESVLDQDYADIEYILVDAGSTDGSRDIIERYRQHIDHIVFEPDRGHSDGMNKGLRLAAGDLYNCTNSDDAFLPGAVSGAVNAFRETPWADVIYGHGYIIDRAGRVVRRFISDPWEMRRFVRTPQPIMHQATFYRAQAFWDVGGFDVTRRFANDSDLLVRLGLAGKRMRRVQAYWGLLAIYPESETGNRAFDTDWACSRELMFELVMGRPRGAIDWLLLDRLARLGRWLTDPRGRTLRVYEMLAGAPQMTFPPVANPGRE